MLKVTHYSGDSSAEKKPSEQKINPPEKSRDSDSAAGPETQAISQSSENNWASFEVYTVDNAPKTSKSNTLTTSMTERTPQATYANPIDLLLSELSASFTATTDGMPEVSSGDNVPTTATEENASACGDLKHSPTSVVETTASPNNSDALSVTSTTATEVKQRSIAAPPHVDLYIREDSIKVSHDQTLSNMQSPPALVSSSTTQPTSTPVPVASNDLVRA